MFEQQFAALLAGVVCVQQEPDVQEFMEKTMTGYREWARFRTPLSRPITVLGGVPEDWDSDEFWKGWRDLEEFGELLFDFWARDLDTWWLDTFRRKGHTIALVPKGNKLYWTDEVELDEASRIIQKNPNEALEIQIVCKATDLKRMLSKKLKGKKGTSISLARATLYQEWELPISYENYDWIVHFYLEKLDFWNQAEKYLESKSLGLAIVPIRGRSLLTPKE